MSNVVSAIFQPHNGSDSWLKLISYEISPCGSHKPTLLIISVERAFVRQRGCLFLKACTCATIDIDLNTKFSFRQRERERERESCKFKKYVLLYGREM